MGFSVQCGEEGIVCTEVTEEASLSRILERQKSRGAGLRRERGAVRPEVLERK